jgi:hypothetical protein
MRPLQAKELLDAYCLWVIEELNVAWEAQKITAERFADVLNFFSKFGVLNA